MGLLLVPNVTLALTIAAVHSSAVRMAAAMAAVGATAGYVTRRLVKKYQKEDYEFELVSER
jgi:hypothetical protein